MAIKIPMLKRMNGVQLRRIAYPVLVRHDPSGIISLLLKEVAKWLEKKEHV
jgi:hypothetical protein